MADRPEPRTMREALDEMAEAFPVDEISDAPWVVERGSIAWMIREGENGPQVGNFTLEVDARWVAAARNAIEAETTQGAAPGSVRKAAEYAVDAWADQWDCSRTPGHRGMDEAIRLLHEAIITEGAAPRAEGRCINCGRTAKSCNRKPCASPRIEGATPPSRRAGDVVLGEVVNALEWCDSRYRQTLAGKPVLDVDEMRAYVNRTLTDARRALSRPSEEEPRG